jgi:hypothetical protein
MWIFFGYYFKFYPLRFLSRLVHARFRKRAYDYPFLNTSNLLSQEKLLWPVAVIYTQPLFVAVVVSFLPNLWSWQSVQRCLCKISAIFHVVSFLVPFWCLQIALYLLFFNALRNLSVINVKLQCAFLLYFAIFANK